jgi:hypothetical protein
MANVDAFNSGSDIGKKAALKGKKTGESSGLFTKTAEPSSYKKGGKVKRTGVAKVHKGEIVLTVAQQKAHGLKKGKRKATGRKYVVSKG